MISRRNSLDFALIICQIIALQSLFYLSQTVLIQFMSYVLEKPVSLDYIFDFHKITLDNNETVITGLVWDINSIFGVLIIFFIVRRSKQVLDFTLTMHFIHFIIVLLYSGSLPTNIYWWVVQIISCLSICLGGEWICMQRELKPIFFGSWQNPSMIESNSHIEQYELDKIDAQKRCEALC
ncbi:hypothetical protein T552_02166 [Pneumocystis carinii B80]|uniref:Protein SYS1 n=1 Tax=Pneumocystis carinii (strain B80) TaxID=1408658 RepID=A0A0W4ZH75_PNEC8|nr:hypothetical protein T552_02166 [Pneumocystis carinii B80]KTW27726.1 hypothetical protein T552_02166 [Pneumocystis carinii B80]